MTQSANYRPPGVELLGRMYDDSELNLWRKHQTVQSGCPSLRVQGSDFPRSRHVCLYR